MLLLISTYTNSLILSKAIYNLFHIPLNTAPYEMRISCGPLKILLVQVQIFCGIKIFDTLEESLPMHHIQILFVFHYTQFATCLKCLVQQIAVRIFFGVVEEQQYLVDEPIFDVYIE